MRLAVLFCQLYKVNEVQRHEQLSQPHRLGVQAEAREPSVRKTHKLSLTFMQIWDRVSLSRPGRPWICHPPTSALRVAEIARLYLPKHGLKFPGSVNDTFYFYSLIIIKTIIMRFLFNPWNTVSCFHLGVYQGYKGIWNILKEFISCFRIKDKHSSNEPSGACFWGWWDTDRQAPLTCHELTIPSWWF